MSSPIKVWISRDERWPDFSLIQRDGDPVDDILNDTIQISAELYERYLKANAEYDAIQDEIAKLFKPGKEFSARAL